MFALFNEYPSLLPPAPEGATTNDCRVRVSLKMPCIHCGQQSVKALLAMHRSGARSWIDLCGECHAWVLEALARIKKRALEGHPTPWEES